MPEAVIVDAIRTPIGRAGKGSLKTVRADELAATPIRELIARNPGVEFAQTNDVLMGAASGVGEQGYNVGRNAALLAGLDHHVPACTVNRFCASSLMTIRMASHAIRAGEGDQYIAAGVEAVSRAGLGAGMMEEAKNPTLNGSDGSLYDVYIPMGMTAENVADRCHVTREQQDEWAVISQNRAVQARDSGHFDAEIVPVTVAAHKDTDKEGNEIDVPETVVRRDDGPRPGTTMEVLAQLRPAFKPDGTVTAGNACPLNDGAAAVLVMSDEKADGLGLEPLAPNRRVNGRRDPPRDHGARPDPGDPVAARADQDDDRRRRPHRDQRGLRRADRSVPRGARDPRGEAQPVRRGDRARPPVRDDRRADHDDADQRPARDRRHLRDRVHVRRRRDGPGDADRAPELIPGS